jgi:hypothetical protein
MKHLINSLRFILIIKDFLLIKVLILLMVIVLLVIILLAIGLVLKVLALILARVILLDFNLDYLQVIKLKYCNHLSLIRFLYFHKDYQNPPENSFILVPV